MSFVTSYGRLSVDDYPSVFFYVYFLHAHYVCILMSNVWDMSCLIFYDFNGCEGHHYVTSCASILYMYILWCVGCSMWWGWEGAMWWGSCVSCMYMKKPYMCNNNMLLGRRRIWHGRDKCKPQLVCGDMECAMCIRHVTAWWEGGGKHVIIKWGLTLSADILDSVCSVYGCSFSISYL